MAKTPTNPTPSKAPAAPEAELLSAEESREETRALIARAMRSAARFVEAHPQHENAPQTLAVLSEFYGTTSNETTKERELQLLGDLAPMLSEVAHAVLSDVADKRNAKSKPTKESRDASDTTASQPSETPPPEEPPQAGASAPVIVHLTKDAA